MNKEELNDRVRFLIQSADNFQEFADLTSLEENWRKIDKNIKVPRNIATTETECPMCFDTVRLIYDKFATENINFDFVCPHCKEHLKCKLEFTGYTSELYLEEY